MKRILPFVVAVACTASCQTKSPNEPSPPPQQQTPTRIIAVSGDLAFGDVAIGATSDRTFSIRNNGNSPLTVTGLTGPGGYAASWTNGTIAAGTSQDVTVRFSPTAEQTYNGTITVNGDQTNTGGNTISIAGRGIVIGPRTQFGAGQWLVGPDIQAGRYFSAPTSSCYWERQSGLGGTFNEIIANDFVGYTPVQYIVDILSSDKAFQTDSDCRTWFNTPRVGFQSTIPAGIFLVGSQVAPGTYRANAKNGCYWERVRDFQSVLNSINANHFQSSDGQILVEIRGSDVGFSSDIDCGTWTMVQADTITASDAQGVEEIRRNRELHRVHRGGGPMQRR